VKRSNTGRLAGATSNTAILGTQQERRHKSVYSDAANAATKHITQDAYINIVRNTGSSINKKLHAVGCKYIHIEANCSHLTVKLSPGVHRQLRNEFIAASNWQLPWSTEAFVYTVRKIENHDVFSSGMFTDEFLDKHPREWTKQALITLEEATKRIWYRY
jgi:hypothetical protein